MEWGEGGSLENIKGCKSCHVKSKAFVQWPPERYFLSSRLRSGGIPAGLLETNSVTLLLEIIKFESDRQASRAGLGARRMAMRIEICDVIGLDGNDKNTDFKAFGKWPFHFPAATRRLLICKVTRFRGPFSPAKKQVFKEPTDFNRSS